jgi:transposase-like protein
MDGLSTAVIAATTTVVAKRKKRQHRSSEERLRIVEEASVPGASVALVARSHGVNANQVFAWRKLHLTGKLIDKRLEGCYSDYASVAAGNGQRRGSAVGDCD